MLVFIYYANDITAKMTSGPPPIPVRIFEDVLEHGYKVTVVSTFHLVLLKSKNGTAKHVVFQQFLVEDYKRILEYERAYRDDKISVEQFIEEGGKDLPKYYKAKTQLEKTEVHGEVEEQMINDPKTLLYCSATCLPQPINEGKVVPLKMDDPSIIRVGFGLRPESEYSSVFNHYLLKGFETGVLKRLSLVWNAHIKPPIKIGMTEPEALGFNTVMMSLFIFLGVTILISLSIALIEKVINKVKSSKRNQGKERK